MVPLFERDVANLRGSVFLLGVIQGVNPRTLTNEQRQYDGSGSLYSLNSAERLDNNSAVNKLADIGEQFGQLNEKSPSRRISTELTVK